MTPSPIRDLLVGLFVLIGLGAIAYLSIVLGGVSYSGPAEMELIATFNEIGGLGRRSQVVIGGVKVGQVESITLDEDFRPRVTLKVDAGLELPDDTSASILTAGVLGDQYISLEPGGSDELLKSGHEIAFTQSALILERLVGKLVQNLGAGGSK
jgi:phospholipid/cholesterol/gamma-HCH transport system substrate-binding protein